MEPRHAPISYSSFFEVRHGREKIEVDLGLECAARIVSHSCLLKVRYGRAILRKVLKVVRARRELNPCYSLERAVT